MFSMAQFSAAPDAAVSESVSTRPHTMNPTIRPPATPTTSLSTP